jgi:lipase maturation factor 1
MHRIAMDEIYQGPDPDSGSEGRSGAGLPERGGPPEYRFAAWLFGRLLAGIYLIAFVSLWAQVRGLYGSWGILPISQYLEVVGLQLGAERFLRVPTLFWLGGGDGVLHLACAAGVLLALLAVAGWIEKVAFAGLWVLYLSFAAAGQEFLSFQWDTLLLEAGLLAIFLTEPWRSRESRPPHPSKLTLWLLWLLLFKLMFSSGVVKLTSGDPTWRDLSALSFHFQTQPIPNPVAWFAHGVPAWLRQAATLAMYGVEIVVPFLILGSARLRRWAAGLMIAFQLAIGATGNYAFFNLLTIALCLLLLDDAWWTRWTGRWLGLPGGFAFNRRRDLAVAPLALLVVVITSVQLVGAFRPGGVPALLTLRQWVAPFRSINSYGLFRVMTTKRPEIVIEGSLDGETWRAYEFRWKPGPLDRPPPFVAPHQPRLDWQMWFAALSPASSNPWFFYLLARLADGSPAVAGLMAEDPFDGKLPRFLRARLWEYRFTSAEERSAGEGWWHRELRGEYLGATPAESLLRLFPGPERSR